MHLCNVQNHLLFSTATYGGQLFLGIAGTWLALPSPLQTSDPSFDLSLLLGMNVAVFLLWKVLDRRWMAKHFVVDEYSLTRRPWTIFTAAFSQDSFGEHVHV